MTAQRLSKRPWQIWLDRRGDVSWLRTAFLIALLIPVAKAGLDTRDIAGGARPLNELIHRSGFWALCFIGLSLAITPFRRILHFGGLLDVRRMIGVAAFFYAAAHLALYIADQKFDLVHVISEVTSRVYLIIGAVAWFGLFVLALTSTDGMVRRLGGMRWRRLHQIVYVCALLVLIHYFQQTKADVTVPTLAAGLFGWLIAYRLTATVLGADALGWLMLAMLTAVVASLVFAGEAIGIAITFGVSPWLILSMAFDFDVAIRPGWIVLAAGLIVSGVEAMARTRPQRRSAAPDR